MEPKRSTCKVSRWQLLKRELNNLDPVAFRNAMEETPGAVLIDVRTPAEFARGCLDNACNIDYLSEDFWDRIEQMDREGTYLVYCRTGRRSVRTCMLMKNGGFRNVLNLDGGLLSWNTAFGDFEG